MKNLKPFSLFIINIFWKLFFQWMSHIIFLTRFCRTNFLMDSLIINVSKRWYCAFVNSQFPDIIFNKVWSFMILKYSNIFENIRTKFSWKILKSLEEYILLLRTRRLNFHHVLIACFFIRGSFYEKQDGTIYKMVSMQPFLHKN